MLAAGARRAIGRKEFESYLRTGRASLLRQPIEVKFNPYHDPQNGRFTSASGGGSFGGGGATGESFGQRREAASLDPHDPSNYTTHVVQAGDTLSKIAAQRRGVTVDDLAWLNDVPADGTLRIGQQIKLPTQASRDAARDAKNRFVALDYYMQTHGGELPANVAHPPSLSQQILSSSPSRIVQKNGYHYALDGAEHAREIKGELSDGPSTRSRRNQALAGGADRLAGDDGGHYIANRFNGPSDQFNHFAQDANFNRGAYRVLEDGWAQSKRRGHRVYVDIVPNYVGNSTRPDSLSVTWLVDGQRHFKNFTNSRGGR